MSWLEGWQYRKSHEIEGSTAGAVTNYQIRITVHYGSGTDSGEHVYLNGKCRTDFGDIRFTDSDGVTELSYWIEEKVDGDYAVFWVKVPSIPASPENTTIYIYYGKSDAITTSNGDDTFVCFDDFEDADIVEWSGDTDKASIVTSPIKSGTYALRFYDPDIGIYWIYWSGLDIDNVCIRTWIRASHDGGDCGIVFRWINTNNYYNVVFYLGSNYLKMFKKINGSSTEIASSSFNVTNNVWYLLEVYAYGSNLSAKVYDVNKNLLAEVSTTDTSLTSGSVGFESNVNAGSAGYAYFDEFRVRKYIKPEPTHGVWGSEEQIIYKIYGYTLDANGNPLPNCTVWLFRTSDKQFIDETISDENGYYEFTVSDTTTEYFIRAHKDDTPNIFGTTDRNLKGVAL